MYRLVSLSTAYCLSHYCLSDKTIHKDLYTCIYMCTSEQFSFMEDESSHSTLRRYMFVDRDSSSVSLVQALSTLDM